MRGKRSVLRILLVLSLALCLGIEPKAQTICASEENEVSKLDEYKSDIRDFGIKTSLYDGDAFETIRLDLIPLFKDLATGTVPNDEFIWKFKDAPLYIDRRTKASAERCLSKRIFLLGLSNPSWFSYYLGEVGLFNLYSLEYKMKTRSFRTANGRMYRCAIVGVSVKSWCSPYGDVCSREEALEYYNQCQERIQSIVSEVIATRQPNGEPLTNEQRLKKIHDWLITNADYAHEKLDLHKANTDKKEYQFDHLWNEYGAIVDGEAVCQGYTYAFKIIVDELARQTGADIVCEEATNSNHSWIRVKLNNEWYNIDTTYDEGMTESLSNIVDDCFLVSDDTFAMLWS